MQGNSIAVTQESLNVSDWEKLYRLLKFERVIELQPKVLDRHFIYFRQRFFEFGVI